MREALATAALFERMPASAFFGQHDAFLARAARLRALPTGEAMWVGFGDAPEPILNIVVIPESSIKFGYQSDEHEAECRPLIERCARVLDCDIVLF